MTANFPADPAEALALLEWYRAAGVDFAVGDTPVDRFATSAAAQVHRTSGPAVIPTSPAASAVSAPPVVPLLRDPDETRQLAASARTLDELRAIMDAYDGCPLKFRATQLCFADGNPTAKVMLIGEGPGEEEDRQGRPFVGRAGQLLDKMLAAIGLDRTKVFIANMVPWRPPGNRNPTPDELSVCGPFLHRQVELVNPRLVVTLGNVPTQSLFATTTGITRMRGQWRDISIGSWNGPALPTLHPAFLLRSPGAKAQAWRDMLALRQALINHKIETD